MLDMKPNSAYKFFICVPTYKEFDEMITHATTSMKKKTKGL